MLITRLFKALFPRGVLVLVTSNYAPQELLPNPLYHERFKPVIDLIAARMEVLEVSSPEDFRQLPQARSAQRFINVIDVLYDRDKHLVLIGELPLEMALSGQAIDLARTASRLGQLQQASPQRSRDPVS